MTPGNLPRPVATGWSRTAAVAVGLVVLIGQLQQLVADEEPIRAQVTVRLVRESKLSARDAGTVGQVNFTDGQSVRQGDVVALLENEQQQLNLRAAQLTLKVAAMQAQDHSPIQTSAAQLQEAKSGRRVSEAMLKIAEAEADSDVAIRIATSEARMRQLELERAESARSTFKGSISEAQIDRLRTSVEKGQLEIEQAQNDHRVRRMKPEGERAMVDQKDDAIHRYEALLEQQEKELEVARVTQEIRGNDVAVAEFRLEQRSVRAPFDGILVDVDLTAGEWVEPGTAVARLIDLNTLCAEGFLPVGQASLSLVGHSVAIDINSAQGTEQVTGTVTFVSPEIDPVNQQVRFRAEFSNPKLRVLPGMNGVLTIEK